MKSTSKFNPKPGDKIICNNGREFICCTLRTLKERITKSMNCDKTILGYTYPYGGWQGWYHNGRADINVSEELDDNSYDIKEVIPMSQQENAKEDTQGKALYTVEDVFDATEEVLSVLEYEMPWRYIDKIKEHLLHKSDKQ